CLPAWRKLNSAPFASAGIAAPEADQARSGSRSDPSTFVTSAPASASSFVQYAPAIQVDRSTTRNPSSGSDSVIATPGPFRVRCLATGAGQPPLRREPVVVVLDQVVDALVHDLAAEPGTVLVNSGVVDVIFQRAGHRLHPGAEHAPQVLTL